MSSRSFTIDKITKTDGTTIHYYAGRFMGASPSQAAKKMFTHACNSMKACPKSLKIKLHETTRGSNKKEYNYKVSKKRELTDVQRGNELITFKYTIKTKAI